MEGNGGSFWKQLFCNTFEGVRKDHAYVRIQEKEMLDGRMYHDSLYIYLSLFANFCHSHESFANENDRVRRYPY